MWNQGDIWPAQGVCARPNPQPYTLSASLYSASGSAERAAGDQGASSTVTSIACGESVESRTSLPAGGRCKLSTSTSEVAECSDGAALLLAGLRCTCITREVGFRTQDPGSAVEV